MSWNSRNRGLSKFRRIPFKTNAPVNENSQKWNQYRLSLARMRSVQARSTHWRATCSYSTQGIDFRDYLRGNFKDFNIVDYIGGGQCRRVEYINIRGRVGKILTVPFWQYLHEGLHIDSSVNTTCQFKAQGLVLWVMKIILVGMVPTTQSFAAQKIPSPLPSGGLKLISNPVGDKTVCIPVINTLKEAIIRIKLIKVIP